MQKKGREEALLLVEGFSGHKPPVDGCEHYDAG
jgi:hypothetical protein